MKQLIAMLVASGFAVASLTAIAQDKMDKSTDKKPTADQCKKDPKMKGCEAAAKPAPTK